MYLFSDKRGVSEVLGAVLVFALVLMLLVLIQTLAVPAANEQIEFDHNQRVQGDFLDLQQGATVAATRGAYQPANVEAGVQYPNRFFLLNPAPASGNVRTEASYFTIENARAIDRENAEFWNGNSKNYTSNTVLYRPNYNHYSDAPSTGYEHGLAYNDHPNNAITLLGTGSVISGNRITLLAVDGNISTTTSSTVPLEVEPLSAPMQSISIQDNGSPITLSLRTGLTNGAWADLLKDEEHVESWTLDDGAITITLEEDVVYSLQMAEVGVGSGQTDEDPEYVAKVGSNPRLTEEGGTELTVEVRDRFNTVETGVNVTWTLEDGQGTFTNEQDTGNTVMTDETGRATIAFQATDNESVTIHATADLDGDGSPDDDENSTVQFENLAVGNGGDDGNDDGASQINPNDEGKVVLRSVSPVGASGSENVILTFESRTGTSVDIVGGRVNFHSTGGPGGSAGGSSPTEVHLEGRTSELEVAGEFEEITPSIEIGTTGTPIQLSWSKKIQENHFYVITLEFSNGDIETYFVSHPK